MEGAGPGARGQGQRCASHGSGFLLQPRRQTGGAAVETASLDCSVRGGPGRRSGAGRTAFGCGPRAHHARALHRVSDMPYFALPAPASRPKKCRSELRVIGLATEVALRVQRDELSRLPPLDVQVTRGAHLHVMASRSFHRWSTAERPFLYREDRHCQQSEPAKDSDVTEP